MLANLSGMTEVRIPTERDGNQFAAILSRFVGGGQAGEFASVECQGLKVGKQ
jgi:hypothetical protein